MEREAIFYRFVDVPGLSFKRHMKVLDLSTVNVGDWFMVSGRVNMGWLKRQLAAGVAGGMKFRNERITPYVTKCVRTA